MNKQESVDFFFNLSKSKYGRNLIGVLRDGSILTLNLAEFLFDSDTTPTKGVVDLLVGNVKDDPKLVKRYLINLDLFESSDFLFTEFFIDNEHLVTGSTAPVVRMGKAIPLTRNDTAVFQISGKKFLPGLLEFVNLPAEVTVDNIDVLSADTVEVTFTNTFTTRTHFKANLAYLGTQKTSEDILFDVS